MKGGKNLLLVFVTAPSIEVARRLANEALKARLIACANLLPRVESHYWWQHKMDSASEVLILMKTSRDQLAGLEKLVLSKHPYDTPEIVGVSIASVTCKYRQWWLESLMTPLAHPTRRKTEGRKST